MTFDIYIPFRHRCSWIVSTIVILTFTFILLAISPQTALATIYGVGCGASRVTSLINVINSANSNNNDDTINLTAGCTYTLTEEDNFIGNGNGLPVIVAGHGTLTINGNGATIKRSSANSTGGDCFHESGSIVTASHTLFEDSAHHCGIADGTNDNIVGQAPHLGGLTGSPKYYPLNTTSPAINEATVNIDLNGDGDKNDTIGIDEPGNPRVRGGTVDMGGFESSIIPAPLLSAT